MNVGEGDRQWDQASNGASSTFILYCMSGRALGSTNAQLDFLLVKYIVEYFKGIYEDTIACGVLQGVLACVLAQEDVET